MATYFLETASFRDRDYVFLDSPVRGILERLKCPICLQLPAEPVSTSCGHAHLFCKECIKDLTSCPFCRLEGFSISPDVKIEQIMNKLRVKCEDCGWQGQLGVAVEHVCGSECEQHTDCPLGCGKKMTLKMRSRIKYHTRYHCPNSSRPCKCRYCGHCVVYKEIANMVHYTTCERFPLECPIWWCHHRSTRRRMQHHLSKECTHEYFACRYAVFGCEAELSVMSKCHRYPFSDQKCAGRKQNSKALSTLGKFYLSPCDAMPDLGSLPLSFRPWLQNKPLVTKYPCPPWIVRAPASPHNTDEWQGDIIYSHFGGYCMALAVKVTFNENETTNHVGITMTVSLNYYSGDYDRSLKFPFKAKVTLSMLNQLEDNEHYTLVIPEPEHEYIINDPFANDEYDHEKIMYEFFFNSYLGYHSEYNTVYLENDTIFLRIDKLELVL